MKVSQHKNLVTIPSINGLRKAAMEEKETKEKKNGTVRYKLVSIRLLLNNTQQTMAATKGRISVVVRHHRCSYNRGRFLMK